ncbi:MAG: M28 family peptidase [Candidatus Zixiibacteriota bacterium]
MRCFLLLFVLSIGPRAADAAYDITADSVHRHIAVLADDSMEGRQVGETGELKAAQYIQGVFAQAGLLPHDNNGSYLQAFEFIKKIDFGPNNTLRLNGQPLEIGRDYQPLEYSASGSFDFVEVVDVGYGIVTDDSSHHDYRDKDVHGKAVLVRRFTPQQESDTTAADTIFDRHAGFSAKISTAIDHGAAGIFFITPETHDDTLMSAGVVHARPKNVPVILLRRVALERLGLNLANPAIESAQGVTDLIRVPDTGYNVVGLLPGKSDTVQIIGAHYDHLGWGGPASRYRGATPMIHNGADDNASGVAALLELARYFGTRRDSLENSLLFIAFSGEEAGTLGSGHYVRNWTVDRSKARLMINMDMIGRLAEQEKGLAILGTGTCAEFKEYFNQKNLGDLKVVFSESGSGPSDHSAFYNDSIPCLFFFTGAHQDYHTPDDDTEKIDTRGIVQVSTLISDIVRHFDNHHGPLTFQRTKGSGTGRPPQLSVSLGIMPDFVSQVKGLGVDGVTPEKPAERAGIVKGDVIIKIGERTVGDIYDYMNALQKYRKGDSCRIQLVRGIDTLEVTVEFK